MKFISLYEKASKQHLNINKSTFYTSKNEAPHYINIIKEITSFQHKSFLFIYLGYPIFKGRRKAIFFQTMFDKISANIQRWKNKTHSLGGRYIFIKHVLSFIPMFVLGSILPPKSVLKEINRISANLFWGFPEFGTNRHWTSWQKVCNPLHKNGLQILNLFHYEEAFAYKLWWYIHIQGSLLATFLFEMYGHGMHPCSIPLASTSSHIWQRLLKVRDKMEAHIGLLDRNGKYSFLYENQTLKRTSG